MIVAAKTPAFQPDSRATNIERLRSEEFDILILGGGINGAGIARDLTLRASRLGVPLRVGLVERRHFASGTSGKNSQLIHGGLRYLKNFEFRLVREALRERATLIGIAPHLVHPQPFLIPMYGQSARAFYGAGLALYDLLAGSKNIGRRRSLTRQEVERTEPGLALDALTGGAIFYDCKIHSARFVLENIFDAARGGAAIANYVNAGAPVRAADGIYRVMLEDTLSGASFETRARKVIDATGPWEKTAGLRLVRGSHLILPRVNHSENAIAHFEEQGRIVFVIPWGSENQFSLVGTTDQDHGGDPDDVHISTGEMEYLLRIVQRLFPHAANLQPIAAYSSLRPLLATGVDSPTRTSRGHRIWQAEDGVVHVAGGKYTTYRAMSQEAADLALREVAPALVGSCFTADTPLGGNGVPPNAGAEPTYAIRHEMAQRLADFLYVSTYLGYERAWTAAALLPIASAMGRELHWNPSRIAREIELALSISAVPAAECAR